MKKSNALAIGLVTILMMITVIPMSSTVSMVTPGPIRNFVEGQEIWEINSDFTFTKDLQDITLVVTADKITINGNGFALHGPGYGIGITVRDRTKVTIENLEIGNWETGILIERGTKNILEDNSVAECRFGIYIRDSSKNRILGNELTDNSVTSFYIKNSEGNHFDYNTIAMCLQGFYSLHGSSNHFVGNEVYWPPLDPPNGGYGFYIQYGKLNTLLGNSIEGLPGGILLQYSDQNYLAENTATNCHFAGYLIRQSELNTLENNDAFYTISYPEQYRPSGFYLSGVPTEGIVKPCRGNVLLENTATGQVRGLHVYDETQENDFIKNTVTDNRRGIAATGGPDNRYIENTVTNNLQVGFSIRASVCSFIGNTVSNNGGHGFWMINSYLNVFEDNIIQNNYMGLEFAGDSFENSVYGNDFEDNYVCLVFLDNSKNNYIYHNNLISETIRISYGPGPVIDDNFLYSPELSEGNYWSDYDGSDEGENGRVKHDGIGDEPIPWHFDLYPFMTMNG
ncbi:MAG: NosD domain-containing protein, partial [Candidatus Thorarchaeota archaeon]